MRPLDWIVLASHAHRSVMQIFLPAVLALALPAGCVANHLLPLQEAVLGLMFVAALGLCIARAAEIDEERRSVRRLFALMHRLRRC